MKRFRRVLLNSLAVFFLLTVVAILTVWVLARASLPRSSGSFEVSGPEQPVSIRFDRSGVPDIEAVSRADMAFGLGYVHGMDRFFQMDMIRRYTAGELSEILGKATLGIDKNVRRFQYRKWALQSYEKLNGQEKLQLQRYAMGVNAGLNALKSRPIEYWLLFQSPEPWKPEDCLLLAYAYYNDMQGNSASLDKSLIILYQQFPKAIADYFAKQANPWQAAMDDSKSDGVPIPDEIIWTGAVGNKVVVNQMQPWDEMEETAAQAAASNQWAVGLENSAEGKVMVANDPHLVTGVPGIWYRASYSYLDEVSNETIQANGFTLPGIPSVVIGQSRWTAWGFTVSDIDSQDLIELIPDPQKEDHYLTGSGSVAIRKELEHIEVRGGNPVDVEIPHSEWGPVVWEQEDGRRWAMHWTALEPDAVNLRIFDLEKCRDLESLLNTVNECRLPVMNCVAGDVEGDVGWTLFGSVPKRPGDGQEFRFRSDQIDAIWSEFLTSQETPRVIRRQKGYVWTANNRVLGDDDYLKLGTGTYAVGSRAYQIAQFLKQRDKVTIGDMESLQHDIEVPFLGRWQAELLELIGDFNDPEFEELKTIVAQWDGNASADSMSYTLIRIFRSMEIRRVFEIVFGDAMYQFQDFNPYEFPYEDAVFRLLKNRVPSVRRPESGSLQEDLRKDLVKLAEYYRENGPGRVQWGENNYLKLVHPLAQVISPLGMVLNMKPTPMEGDSYCPKVVRFSHVASMRMIAVPGNPEMSRYQMPTGQSGNPVSQHYQDLHQHWLGNEYLPMKATDPETTLTLLPLAKGE